MSRIIWSTSSDKQRTLGECILISTLQGKALIMLVELRGLHRDLTCVLEAEPGKLVIKGCEPGIISISLPISSLFKIASMP